MSRAEVVFSGMRPTGRLHVGNYWGALRNWVELVPKYQCYYSVADWHMLTTGYAETGKLRENVREMVLDWLAAGLDPEKCVIFRQSDVPEHAELALMLSMVTPLSWLENNPAWKEQLQELAKTKLSKTGEAAAKPSEQGSGAAGHELRTHGFIGYPVLQAADILLYRGTKVPIGQDQLPHLEISREIARKFNSLFSDVFPEPQPLLTPTPRVPGLDGRKMSKSYGNALDMYETAESLQKKVMSMYTDAQKLKASTPGFPEPCPENPAGCVVFAMHKLYSPDWAERGEKCRAGALGCVADKKDLIAGLEKPYSDFRAKRERLAADAKLVDEVLAAGASKARAVAQKTMDDVRRAMRLR
jgi:tryptophanyl-tRNA synthetase